MRVSDWGKKNCSRLFPRLFRREQEYVAKYISESPFNSDQHNKINFVWMFLSMPFPVQGDK